MNINNENLRNVAQVAADIMTEKKLHPNQQKLDVHEPEKDELTADDFKKLRAMKKEETEQVDEAMQKSDVPAYLRKQKGEKPLSVADVKGPRPDSISSKEALAKANEEVETVEEAKSHTVPKTEKEKQRHIFYLVQKWKPLHCNRLLRAVQKFIQHYKVVM